MKHKTCPKCGGNMKDAALGWICQSCKGLVDVKGNFYEHIERPFMPPMTNADYIRSMSDEELAEWICSTSTAECCDMSCPARDMCSYKDNGMIKWLKQPYKENEE